MADIEQQEHTQEEKFFGVKHTIGDEDDTEVEVVSEEPEVVVTTEEEPVEKPAWATRLRQSRSALTHCCPT